MCGNLLLRSWYPRTLASQDMVLPFLRRSSSFILLRQISHTSKLELLEYNQQPRSRHYSFDFCDLRNETSVESLHAEIVKSGSFPNVLVSNHVLHLYAKSLNLIHAHKLFDELPYKDVRTWTILLSGFVRSGSHMIVLDLFRRMQVEGVRPNQFTLSSVLKCCASLTELRKGKEIHGWVLRNEIGLDSVLENSIIDLYMKCGAFEYAKSVFESMKGRDTVSWNIMIGGYLYCGDVKRSLQLFESLHFKDVASWNTIIDGLMRNGFERIALEQLYKMVENGPAFNAISFCIALNLVSCLLVLELGKQIHGQILRLVIQDNGFVRNSLVDMYCKCGKMKEASTIFRKMPIHISFNGSMAEIVLWSLMVSGYVQNGDYEGALQTFGSMVHEHVGVDKFTLTSIVSACANTGNLDLGRQIHAQIQKVGHKVDAHLASSLIDMYAKCGSLNDACMIFKQTNDRTVVLWSSMICGCALHGQGREAVELFDCMMNEGIAPTEITFVGILTACSHGGLIEEGRKYFELMQNDYGMKPEVEHYTCMVDLYGRAGRLHEIKDFIYENGISHLTTVWKSFLSSCRLHKNVEMGKWVFERLLQLKPSDAGSYVLLSNMFAADRSWEEAAETRTWMQRRKVEKLRGESWIQLKNQVYALGMGDRSHPQSAEIYAYLEKLIGRLKEIGYSFDEKPIMQDVEKEESEILLGFHSEKLAVVYGIMSTPSGTPIRVMKNLRVCTDCHRFIKYTSQLLCREIIVRDVRRFHHFKDGHCSCGDYW